MKHLLVHISIFRNLRNTVCDNERSKCSLSSEFSGNDSLCLGKSKLQIYSDYDKFCDVTKDSFTVKDKVSFRYASVALVLILKKHRM